MDRNGMLNLGLMDEDVNDDTNNEQKASDAFGTLRNLFNDNKKTNQTPNEQKPNLTQARLESFVSYNNSIDSNQNKKPAKKLFNNLNNLGNFKKDLNIKIFGIGGAGNNMVNHMARNCSIDNSTLFAINTDYQVLRTMPDDINVLLIGDKITNGYGSGSDPEIGKKAAIESEELIRMALEDTDILFIVSGMGKGTGTGASPIIAQIAKEMGIITLALVNLPSYSNEGSVIYEKGKRGLRNLSNEVAGIMTISNEKIFNETDPNVTLDEAFRYANSVISNVIYELINLITVPSKINIDFNDVKTFFKEPILFQLNTFDISDDYEIEQQLTEQLRNQIYQDSILGANKAIVNFKLNPNVNRDIISNVRKALNKITGNDELQITYSLDYFDQIDFARVSILTAMGTTDENNENFKKVVENVHYGSNIDEHANGDENNYNNSSNNFFTNEEDIVLEMYNTKTEELEQDKVEVRIPTNELLNNNNETGLKEKSMRMRDVLSNFNQLKNETNVEIDKYNGTSNMVSDEHKKVRSHFIPTKKLGSDEFNFDDKTKN